MCATWILFCTGLPHLQHNVWPFLHSTRTSGSLCLSITFHTMDIQTSLTKGHKNYCVFCLRTANLKFTISVNNQLDAQFFFIYFFLFFTCFRQPCAHHQKNYLYQYDIWYMSLCIEDGLVCRLHLHNKRSSIQSDMYQMSYWYN